jgi:SAM-dependent methyltransferase
VTEDPASLRSARHIASRVFEEILKEGDLAVDATLGTGQDCEQLCRLVGETGQVYGFDVQQKALDLTRERLEASGISGRAALILSGHERMMEFVPPGIRLAAFNLGWLPGSGKEITTRAETTLTALDAALRLLCVYGMAVVCAYPGHAEGAREQAALLDFAGSLPSNAFTVLWHQFINGGPGAPGCLLIEKIKEN